MQAHRSGQLFPALMATWLSASSALADAPLPAPEDKAVCSPSGVACAVMNVDAGRTSFVKDGRVLWRMPGWFRDAYLADDGEHFVVGYDGLSLLWEPRPDTTMITFWRRGRLVRDVALSEVIEDFSRLERTASHLLWGHTVGFDARGRFLVHTVEDRMLAFDVESGFVVESRPATYPGHQK